MYSWGMAKPGQLTPKQERFVEEYLKDLNATQAAIRAGYSAHTAEQQGPRLLGNVGIQEAIRVGQEARSKRTKIDADWVLRRLKEEADAKGEGTSHSARVKALELFCKHLGLFADETINLNLKGQVNVKHAAELSDDDLARIAAEGK